MLRQFFTLMCVSAALQLSSAAAVGTGGQVKFLAADAVKAKATTPNGAMPNDDDVRP